MKTMRCALVLIAAIVLSLTVSGCKRAETISGAGYNASDWESRMKSPSLSEDDFTRLYAQAVAASLPNAKVQIVGQRHLKLTLGNGGDIQAYLDNAWKDASQDAERRPEVCQRYISALAATATASGKEEGLPDTNSIVAVIRDIGFLSQFRKFEGTTNAFVTEPLVADIYVAYACDSEKGISYLTEGRRKALGLSVAALRPLALANFHRIIPELQVVGAGPVFMLKADGNYESSMLLADKLWTDKSTAVQGELVAAVPARDALLFTGSGSADGVKQLRAMVDKIQEGGSHTISKTLLVRRNGKWQEWK